ncbi:MAG TPA: TetR/AcrR family transcriptional regulator [Candidatus Binataceae bacterium]|nr:TetR/AcrR family transcriptional regulator [Candidatus Binataceae bacterium]
MKNEVKEFKRQRILIEAAPLFAEYGFQNVAIDTIAKRLSVTKPFIYTYFENKTALLEAIYERAVNSLASGVAEILAVERPPEEQLRQFVEFYVMENIKSADLTAIFLNEEKNLPPAALKKIHAQHHSFDRSLANLIREGVKKGVFDVDDPMLASFSISGMVRWVHRWYNPNGRLKPEEIVSKMARLALNIVAYSPEKSSLTRKRTRADHR